MSRRRSRKDRISDTVIDVVPGEAGTKLAERLIDLDAQGKLDQAGAELMAESHLLLAVKSLGYKCGFSAPQRNGAPRLVLETSMLSAIVQFFGEADMTSQDLATKIHGEVGVIVGYPTNVTSSAQNRLTLISGGSLDIEEALQRNQYLFDERLVQSGLARQYSDGTTVIEDSFV